MRIEELKVGEVYTLRKKGEKRTIATYMGKNEVFERGHNFYNSKLGNFTIWFDIVGEKIDIEKA